RKKGRQTIGKKNSESSVANPQTPNPPVLKKKGRRAPGSPPRVASLAQSHRPSPAPGRAFSKGWWRAAGGEGKRRVGAGGGGPGRGPAVLTCAPAPAAYLVQAVRAAGRCDAVFRGFSDCLLRLGDNMANYPQDLDDKRNLQTICAYWDDFHACTLTALTDCQEGATDLWEKLRRESKNLDFQGSLFELCGGGSGAAPSLLPPALPLLLAALWAALVTWLPF
uniref:Neuritin 1 n=24 Tax=Neoaves TaxID=3078114 RepID=A0A8C9MF89_SERCA